MHEWTRAERDGRCGGCDRAIASGEAVRLTIVAGVRRRFVRCGECAGGAPPELPADVATAPDRSGFAPLLSVKPRTRGELRQLAGSPLRVVNE